MTKLLIVDMNVGSDFETHLAVQTIGEPLPYKDTSKPGKYIDMWLSDSSDTINAKYFGNDDHCNDVNNFFKMIKRDKIYNFKGKVGSFKNKKQLVLSNFHLPEPASNIVIGDFLPSVGLDTSMLYEKMLDTARQIKDESIKKLLLEILYDAKIKEKLLISPAAINRHHAYVGGLLEHTLELVDIAKTVCTIYPNMNKDMLIAGCIIHDIGKIYEYDITFVFRRSDSGKLLGHIRAGQTLVQQKIDALGGFSESKRWHLLHMIESHHGEYGDIPPKTLEAVALHHIDNLSAQTRHIDTLLQKNLDQKWITSYKQEYYNTLYSEDDGKNTGNSTL